MFRPLILFSVLVLAGTGCASDVSTTNELNETNDLTVLPVRDGPREETTQGVPRIQTSSEPIAEVDAELRRRALSLPGIETGQSKVSLPAATGLWLTDDYRRLTDDIELTQTASPPPTCLRGESSTEVRGAA